MAYYSKYTGAELEERLDKVEEIPQLIAQMITGKDFVTKEDLLCVLKDYAPADYRTIPIDNNTIYWENGVLKAATSEGGQCQWELREHKGIQYLFSRLPVVTQYDVTMYADVNHLDLPNIYDGLPIDGNTIYWEETENGRILKSKYEGSSGVDASEVLSIVSSAGYATQNWVNNQNFISSSFLYTELAKYVKIKDYQEIEGVKNFLNGLQIAGLPITKLNGYEDVIYIDANVVVRGGLTMYYEDGEIDLPSIKDEIGNAGYDGVTGLASFNSSQFSISSDGTVTIIGGSTGLDTAQLKDYLDSNKYTTETWVKAQGYASASSLSSLQTKVNNFLEGSDTDTIINKWKELEVFLSGLSESDNLATILSTKWTTDNNLINQWNIAYGWGDHSKVGYALKSYVDGELAKYVTLGTKQTIIGEKDFTGGLKVNGSPIYYDATNKYWKLEGDLLVTGGVTMYGTDEGDLPSILDSLPIASTSSAGIASFDSTYFSVNTSGKVTLTSALSDLFDVESSVSGTTSSDVVLFKSANSSTWTTKPLSEIGGGSGGGSVSGNYLPLNNTSTPIVLNTQARVVNFKSSNAYEVGIGLIRGNTDKGSLYASNSSIGIHNKVKDTAFYLKDDGGLKYEINGVEHDVLNAGNYSSYALPLSGGTLTNTLKVKQAVGLWIQKASTQMASSSIPYIRFGKYTADDTADNTTVNGELGVNDSKELVFYKGTASGSWLKVLHEDNYSNYALPLSGGTITGSLTVNGSFGSTSVQVGKIFLGTTNEINGTGTSLWINFRGNAQLLLGNNGYPVIVGTYANQAANIQDALNHAPFSVFGTIFGYRYGKKASGAAFMFDKPGPNYTGIGADGTTDTIYFGACNKDGDWVSYNQIWKFGGSIECGLIECGALKIWDTNVIDAVSGSGVHLNYHGSSNVTFCKGGGTTIAYGNLLTHGGITMYSDQRKKTILNHVELSLKQIADAPLIEHYYNSDQDKTTHVGSIAQYWAGLNDWFCKLDNEGYYTMEIQNCALASAISIARHLEKYESKTDKKIQQLKKRISQLEDELELLKKGV